jgi:hypothetical protein
LGVSARTKPKRRLAPKDWETRSYRVFRQRAARRSNPKRSQSTRRASAVEGSRAGRGSPPNEANFRRASGFRIPRRGGP